MDLERMKEDIQKLMDEILDKKAFEGVKEDVASVLKDAQTTIASLTERVVTLEADVEKAAASVEEKDAAIEALKEEIAAKEAELEKAATKYEELKKVADEAASKLKELELDRVQAERMATLEENKVARSGDAREEQAAKVRTMSDEEFKAYTDELVAIREEVAAALKAELASDNSADDATDGSDVTPPADVDGAREDASVLPNADGDNTGFDWSKFGPALAKYMRETDDK